MNELWVEKYRPSKIGDCILPTELKQSFAGFVDKNYVPNLLLSGGPGVGKTTVARAMLEECEFDYIVINGSMNGNIDTLRVEIKNFASTVSLTGNRKYVILDEADYLNPQSTQPALRNFMEEYSKNCGFILTCNFKNRVIEPLHSRCGVYEFNTSKKDMQVLCGQMLNRVKFILKEEGMPVGGPTLQGIAELIMRHAPDWRRVLNELQRATSSGSLDTTSLTKTNTSYDSLYKSLKDKDFKKMRSWVTNNMDVDSSVIFRTIYDNMYEKVESQSIPQLVLILADYQYKDAFVADHELNLVACMTEIMANVEFK